MQAAGFLLSGCGSDAKSADPPPPPPVDTTAPSVPTGISANATSPTSVSLSWVASTDTGNGATGVAGYRVFRDAGATAIGTTATTTFVDSGASPNTLYSYSVQAYDAAVPPNSSAMSGPVSATTPPAQANDTTPPSLPTNFRVTSVTANQVNLAWSASTDASGIGGYRIYRNGGATPITTTTATSYADNGLAASTNYTYEIVAFDASAAANATARTPSPALPATTSASNDTTPPAAPTGLAAQPQTDTAIQLTWDASADTSGIQQYRLYRGATLVATIDGAVTPLTYTETGLTASTAYTYEVTAVDNAPAHNESVRSVAATATTNATPPPPDNTPPTTPGSFTATTTGTTSIRLRWTASSDTSGIREYRITRVPAFATEPKILPGNTLTYSDTGLNSSTTYAYTIFAVDNANPANVSSSATASARTNTAPDTTPPSVPTNLAAQVLSSSSIKLTWTASTDASGISGYRVFRDGAQINISATASYTDNGLTANTAYSYTVAAVDASPQANVSAQTAAVIATTNNVPPDTTPPAAPTGITAVAQSSSAILVSWSAATDASGISGYQVFRNNTGTGTPLATVGGSTLTFTDTQLTADTQYSYTLRAVDGAPTPNVSAPSAVATTRTLVTPDTTPPTVPVNVVATAQSSSSILVTWAPSTDDSGVFSYSVFRNGGATPVGIVSTPSFTDTGLAASTTYTYTVRATDNATPANVSAASAPASATTSTAPPPLDTTPPTVPQNLTATALSGTSIRLNWSASSDTASGVASYQVFRNGGATPVATVTSPTITFTDTGLTSSATYSYRVAAVDGAPIPNISAQSASANATTFDVTPPSVPGGVTATAQTSSSILVSWSASTDASGIANYRVFRNGGSTPVGTVTATSFTDNGLAASTAYSYTVSAVDNSTNANVSAPSSPVSATTLAASGQSGLDSRPSNTSCVAGAPPSSTLSIAIQQAFTNVAGLDLPVKMVQAANDSSFWYVVQQGGTIKRFPNQSNATATAWATVPGVFMSGESGLLSIAFHPNYPTDPRVFVSYNAGTSSNEVSRISEFQVTSGGAFDASSERILLTVNQPSGFDNHKGGDIAFGPDGNLYITFGDGGNGNDMGTGHHEPTGNGQYQQTLLGKMLRITVGAYGDPYTIPSDNPYSSGARAVNGTCSANCQEIYALGFRNPWRWGFDKGTGDLWVGDVGEGAREEVDKVVKGGNYGWRCREGTLNTGFSCGSLGSYIDPVAEYDHNVGTVMIGGYVYRGSAIPALVGRYVFGDFSQGLIWTIPNTQAPTLRITTTGSLATPYNFASFAQGNDGELYIVDLYSGNIGKIVQGSGGGGGGTIPTLLSDTGCVNSTNHQQPASGLIPFAPNAPFFSDGAIKQRWMALPNGSQITIENNNDFTFPNGTVLMKNFTLGTRLVETRLFMHHTDGSWAGYTYEWDAQGTDATRVIGGKTVTINGQTWEFPSESQCLTCHTAVAGRSLGPEVGSLNGDIVYPATGRTANQLVTHNAIGTLTPAAPPPASAPLIPNPFGAVGTVDERARAYLHANCSYCHQPGGPTPVNLDFRYTTTLLGTNACNVAPTAGDLGLSNPMRIKVGDATNSVVVARVNRTDANAMPPLMRHTIDTAGVQLLSDWVNGLTSCN